MSRSPLRVVAQAIACVAVAAALAAAAFLFGIPGVLESPRALEERREALETEIRDQRMRNDIAEKFMQRADESARWTQALQKQTEVLRIIVPEEPAAEQFEKTVRQSAAAAGLQIRGLEARPLVERDFYSEVPFQWYLEGKSGAVLAFVQRLERAERIMAVSELSLSPLADGKALGLGNSGRLGARCFVTAYFLKGPGSPLATRRR